MGIHSTDRMIQGYATVRIDRGQFDASLAFFFAILPRKSWIISAQLLTMVGLPGSQPPKGAP
jgi:hypothetical protein